MLVLNGNKFAKNNKEFTGSLFHRGGTCVGYYKANKATINLYDMQRNKVGVITKHKVLAKATKLDNGKYWYSYGDIAIVGKYASYSKKCDDIREALHQFNIL